MENKFMRVEEVAAELGVSVSYAYKVIRRLNDELKADASENIETTGMSTLLVVK